MRDFFAFRTMISGFVIQVVFVLGLIAIVIAAIASIANDQAVVGLLVLVFGTLYWRIVCELFIVIFRMNKSLDAIRANTAPMASAPGGNRGTPDPGGSARTQEAAPVTGPAEPFSTGRGDEPAAATSVAPATPATTPPAAGWYDDSERPGHKRWWDGTKWGARDDDESSA